MTSTATWIRRSIQSIFTTSTSNNNNNNNNNSNNNNNNHSLAGQSNTQHHHHQQQQASTSSLVNSSGHKQTFHSTNQQPTTTVGPQVPHSSGAIMSTGDAAHPPSYEEIANQRVHRQRDHRQQPTQQQQSGQQQQQQQQQVVTSSSRQQQQQRQQQRSRQSSSSRQQRQQQQQQQEQQQQQQTENTSGRSCATIDIARTSAREGEMNIENVFRPTSNANPCDIRRALNGVWASRGSSLLGCFLCCVNFYTLSRFSLLAYFFKGPFLLQFLILSLLYGLPVVLFLSSLGQYLGSGFADLWFISPAFKGIGFALIFTYSVISVYSCVPIAWFFVYFRDSFLSSRETPFRWAYCSLQFNTENCLKYLNMSSYEYVGWSVSSYLHGKILDRSSKGTLVPGVSSSSSSPSSSASSTATTSSSPSSTETGIKADLLLNLGIIWSLLFLCLYQGLHRAGKVIIGASCLAITFFTMVSFRFMETYGNSIDRIFSGTDKAFFLDGTSWLLAARETFIVWTVFGGAMLTVCSHNKSNHRILHQTLLLFVLVISILLLSACFFASAMEAISRRGLVFYPSSFENEIDTSFLKDTKLLASNVKASDFAIVSGSNLLIGENLVSSKIFDRESHYGIVRFATEIFPAVLACEGPHKISAFWPMIFYLTAILLNLGSLVVVVGGVIDALINLQGPQFKVWRPTITFIACISGFLLSLPLGTRIGLHFLYYLDFCMASLWWMSLLYLLLVIAVLVIRGRPVGTENLVSMIITKKENRKYALPLLTFHWNLITPIFLMILSVSFTRSYSPAGLTWTQVVSLYPHWPLWAQYMSIFLQILPLCMVFLYGLCKATLLLTTSHKPLHERLQDLFCPVLSTRDLRRRGTFIQGLDATTGVINEAFHEDPPPKYTPPPSYSAATSRSRLRRNLRIGSSITIDLPNLSQMLSQATLSPSNTSSNVTNSSCTVSQVQLGDNESSSTNNNVQRGCSSPSSSGGIISSVINDERRHSDTRDLPTDEKSAQKCNSGKN